MGVHTYEESDCKQMEDPGHTYHGTFVLVNLTEFVKLTCYVSVFCNRAAENEAHLFLSCDLIYELWCKVYGWMQYFGAQQDNIQQHFLQHGGLFKGKERNGYLVCSNMDNLAREE